MRNKKLYRVEIRYQKTSAHYVDAYDEDDAYERAWDEFQSRERGTTHVLKVDIDEEEDY